MATFTITETITIKVIACANCGINFGITEDFQERRRNDHDGFYCPNGHSNVYNGKNEAEKLRDELKRKEQELANEAIRKLNIQNELEKANKQLKRLKNGVCPCCNRSFHNLQQHIKKQHPEVLTKG